MLNHLLGAPKANTQGHSHALILPLRLHHPLSFGSPETVNVLERITDSNEPTSDKSFEHRMVDWRKVLVFVNKDQGKPWICSSEQCGHINLIVIIDVPIVSRLY